MKTITTRELAEISGCSERWLRQLASDGQLPKPKLGQWPYPAVLKQIVAHFRQSAERVSSEMVAAKLDREQSKARIARTQAAQAEGKLVDADKIHRLFATCALAAKHHFYQSGEVITAEAQMRLALSTEQVGTLSAIIRTNHHRALSLLHAGEWLKSLCPHCSKEILKDQTNEKTKN